MITITHTPNRSLNKISQNTLDIIEGVKNKFNTPQKAISTFHTSSLPDSISYHQALASNKFTDVGMGLYKSSYNDEDYGRIWIKKSFTNEAGEKEDWLVAYEDDEGNLIRQVASEELRGMQKAASLQKQSYDTGAFKRYPNYRKYFLKLQDLIDVFMYGRPMVISHGTEFLMKNFPELDEIEAQKVLNIWLGEVNPFGGEYSGGNGSPVASKTAADDLNSFPSWFIKAITYWTGTKSLQEAADKVIDEYLDHRAEGASRSEYIQAWMEDFFEASGDGLSEESEFEEFYKNWKVYAKRFLKEKVFSGLVKGAADVKPENIPIGPGIKSKNITIDESGGAGTAKVTIDFTDVDKGLDFYQNEIVPGGGEKEAPKEGEVPEEQPAAEAPVQGPPTAQGQPPMPQVQPKASSLKKISFTKGEKVVTKNNIKVEDTTIPKGTEGTITDVSLDYGSNRDRFDVKFKEYGTYSFTNDKDSKYFSKASSKKVGGKNINEGDSVKFNRGNSSFYGKVLSIKDEKAEIKITKVDSYYPGMEDYRKGDEVTLSVNKLKKVGGYGSNYYQDDDSTSDAFGQTLMIDERVKNRNGEKGVITQIQGDRVWVKYDNETGAREEMGQFLTKWSTVTEFSDKIAGIKVYRYSRRDNTLSGKPWNIVLKEVTGKKEITNYTKYSFVNEEGKEVPIELNRNIKVGEMFERPDTHDWVRFAGWIDKKADDTFRFDPNADYDKVVRGEVFGYIKEQESKGVDGESIIQGISSIYGLEPVEARKLYGLSAGQNALDEMRGKTSATLDISIDAEDDVISDILDSILDNAGFEDEDELEGGLADDMDDEEFEEEDLNKGKDVEKEHTDDEELAKEITKDHLMEDDDYYDKLKKMEEGKDDDESNEKESSKIATVVKEDGKWKVKNKAKTKTLGTHTTKKDAEKQLQAIEINKHSAKDGDKIYFKINNSIAEVYYSGNQWIEGNIVEGEEPEGWGVKTYPGALSPADLVMPLSQNYGNAELSYYDYEGDSDVFSSKKKSNLNKLAFDDLYNPNPMNMEEPEDFDEDDDWNAPTSTNPIEEDYGFENIERFHVDFDDETGMWVVIDSEEYDDARDRLGKIVYEDANKDTAENAARDMNYPGGVSAAKTAMNNEDDLEEKFNEVIIDSGQGQDNEEFLQDIERAIKEKFGVDIFFQGIEELGVEKVTNRRLWRYLRQLSEKGFTFYWTDYEGNKINKGFGDIIHIIKTSSKTAADISDEIPPMSLTTDQSKSDVVSPQEQAQVQQPLPPNPNLNNSPGDVLYDSTKTDGGGGSKFQVTTDPSEKTVTVKFLEDEQNKMLDQAINEGAGAPVQQQPAQNQQPLVQGQPKKNFEDTNSQVSF